MLEPYHMVGTDIQKDINLTLKVLLIEDNVLDVELFQENLSDTQYKQATITVVESIEQAKALEGGDFCDIIVADLNLRDTHGFDTVQELMSFFPEIPIILLTGLKDFDFARIAIKKGVQDYLIKDNMTYYSLESAFTHALERHKILKNLQHTIDILQEKNKLLDQISRSLSHDYRSPVNNILALLRLMQVHPDNSTLYQDKSLESAQSLLKNMEDMLSLLNRHQNLYLRNNIVSFKEMWETIYLTMNGLIEEIDAVITTDFSDAETIVYPAFYLRSAMQNLITNALKYHSKERRPHIHISSRKVNNFICLSVRDNGIGIDMNKHGNVIFGYKTRFNQQASGRGLGLYYLKNQVETMGGSIEVRSQINEGSEFLVFLKNQD